MLIAIYVLCGLTSFACAALQLRAYLAVKSRFLLWTTICFASFFLNNTMLFIDSVTGPSFNLIIPRSLVLLFGLSVLLFGLVWEVS